MNRLLLVTTDNVLNNIIIIAAQKANQSSTWPESINHSVFYILFILYSSAW